MTDENGRARERVRNELGSDFASKASDALCQALAPGGVRRGVPAGPVQPVVELEVQPPPSPGLEELAAALRELPEWGRAMERARAVLAASGVEGLAARAGALLGPAARLRDVHVREMRERCYREMGPIVDRLREAPRGRVMRGGARAGAALPAPPVQVCWLNQTVRTAPDLRRLAEVAPDRRVRGFRVSGKLRPELHVTSETVGAARHRAAHGGGGRGVVVGVIDSEVHRWHPAFGDRVVHRMNYTGEPWGNPGKHGTAMAGIIAAGGPELFGMAPEAVIYNYKVLTGGTGALDAEDFDLAMALQQALEDGVHVANCSLGSTSPHEQTHRLALACDNAWALGMTIVKSAGNTGPKKGTITPPGAARGLIVVGATGRNGLGVETYSSRGPAPGRECCPDLVAPGGSCGDEVESCLPCGGIGASGYGTSQAAAHVSGLLALLLEAEPDLPPGEQRARLLACCDDGVLGGEHAEGRGLVSLARLA